MQKTLLKEGYILDYCTGKPVDIRKPEEIVRQEYERLLIENYHYLKEQIDIEVSIHRGSNNGAKEKADIVIYKTNNINRRDQHKDILCIVETKKAGRKDGIRQLKTYLSATNAEFGVWTNGEEIEYLYRDNKTGDIKEKFIYQLPKRGESLEDIDLITKDKLEPAKNLKTIFRRIHRTLYSNTNISRKEKLGSELIRLIFCKIYDELHNRNEHPKFRIDINEEPESVKKRIVELWEEVKKDLVNDGIFEEHETIIIDPKSIVYIVGELQNYSLTSTDKDVIGAAFEIFAERQFVGEKGEFFTPRPIVKMCVDILDPSPDETIIDPACGSGGFLIYALEHVWAKMEKLDKYKGSPKINDFKKEVAQRNFYGIDKEIDLVKICKAYMQIIGDGKSNIICADSLKPSEDWSDLARSSLTKNSEVKKFDIVITNPPFGSKIKVKHDYILKKYELGHNWKNGEKAKGTKETDPQILFIELCFNLLKDGGRMAIVLPDGIFGNPRDDYIRNFIKERGEILAIIDCDHTSFMPHTHTKTSVLIIKKWDDKSLSNYPILMSIIEKCGHDNRGNEIFTIDENGKEVLDEEFSLFTKIFKNNPSRVIKKYDKRGFTMFEGKLKNNILIPRYYNPNTQIEIDKISKSEFSFMSVEDLISQGFLNVRGAGTTVNNNECSIYDEIPFLRTSDLGFFETRPFAVQNVSKEVYLKYKDKQNLREGDILFVKDGTYRIGENIILGESSLEMLVQSHFLIFRSVDQEKLSPYLVFYLLNQPIVKKQIREKSFIQSTLSTIGDRYKELLLPFPKDNSTKKNIEDKVRTLLTKRQLIRKEINQILS